MPASLIYTDPSGARLYQGGAQDVLEIDEQKTDAKLVVLSAYEFQPEIAVSKPRTPAPLPYMETVSVGRGGFKLVYAPLDDTMMMDPRKLNETTRTAFEAAKRAAKAIRNGDNVLVSCFEGRNRSGLITGMTLKLVTDASMNDIIYTIQQRRLPHRALTNDLFVSILQSLQ